MVWRFDVPDLFNTIEDDASWKVSGPLFRASRLGPGMCSVFVKDVTGEIAVDVAGDGLAGFATRVGNDCVASE